MFVRIRRLRQGGRRIPDHEAHLEKHEAVGDLQSAARKFELHQPLANTGPGYVLHDARVICVLPGVGGMIIRGFEECRGAAVLQEWEVTPVESITAGVGAKR